MRVILYPSGVELKPCKGQRPRRKALVSGEEGEAVGGVRGKVEGFSRASARRLRLAFLSWDRPGFLKCAFTLTVKAHREASEWRALMEWFRQLLALTQFSLIWRIELQKRGTPHLHGVVWCRDSDHCELFRVLWLQASKQSGDLDAEKFACAMKVLEGPEWLAYCAAHASKTKQLGWVGRQWGIWGKRWLVPVQRTEVQISARAAVWCVRLLRRWKGCKVGVQGFSRLMCGSLARRFVSAGCALAESSSETEPINHEDLSMPKHPTIARARHALPY